MFLAMLNETQKKAFLSLAARFVAEDKLIGKGEMGWIDGLKREMGMGKKIKAGDEPPEDLFPVFDTHMSRVVATLEIIRLGYVDGVYSTAENAFVAKMALPLNFPRNLYALWTIGPPATPPLPVKR